MRVFSVEETQALAEKLANLLTVGDCITLQGDLGAGKTTFVQSLIRTLSDHQVGVTSPTFNLLQTYDVTLENGEATSIWHYDLYRIENEEELLELALEDALEDGVTVIEWPELILHALPDSRISIVIDFGECIDGRDISFTSHGEAAQRLEDAGLC